MADPSQPTDPAEPTGHYGAGYGEQKAPKGVAADPKPPGGAAAPTPADLGVGDASDQTDGQSSAQDKKRGGS